MAIQAKDLPDEVREQLLEVLRNTMGQYEYQRSVALMGEDRLLDLHIARAEAEYATRTPTRPVRSEPSVGCLGVLAYLCAIITYPVYSWPVWIPVVGALGKPSEVPVGTQIGGGLAMMLVFFLAMLALGMEAKEKGQQGCLGALHALYLLGMVGVGLIWTIVGLVHLAR